MFGGVVPELASRAHLAALDAVVRAALDEARVDLRDIALFAATGGPGLIGALLVGLTWTKSAAWAVGRPMVGVHHLEGHIFAIRLTEPRAIPPFVALLVSGGHTLLLHVAAWGTYRWLGGTRDDAAGEAFDKAAKLLGLDYPGGPAIERAASEGDPARHPLPRPMLHGGQRPDDPAYFDVSFSGLKTALRNRVTEVEAKGRLGDEVRHLAASFQAAAVEVLAAKALRAMEYTDCRRLVLGGGVANNAALRDVLRERMGERGELFAPPPRLATDNAAMIAAVARFRADRGEYAGLDLSARADLPLPGLMDGEYPKHGLSAC